MRLSFSLLMNIMGNNQHWVPTFRDGKLHLWAAPSNGIVDKALEGQRPIHTITYSAAGKAALACKFGAVHNVLAVVCLLIVIGDSRMAGKRYDVCRKVLCVF
jgi:hypothetical protein